jgi:ribokinase
MRTITVIGSINIDLVLVGDRLPRPGETVLGRDFRVVPGGKGANQAVAAARLGASVRFVGCVGDDDYGRLARRNLAGHGIDVRGVRTIRRTHTGIALIMLDCDGRNLIGVGPGANRHVVCRRRCDVAVTQLETPWRLPVARFVILNPAPANVGMLIASARTRRGALRGVDAVIPNEVEAEQLTGRRNPARAAEALRKMGAQRVIITLGERGVYADGYQPAFRVTSVCDTVGAGDAFVGAFAAAMAEGHADPVRFAQAAAALKCTRPGAQNVPSRAEVERLVAGS